MSCLYNVRFLPEAMCNYDDELIVESLSSPLVVPIHARRPPPVLTCESLMSIISALVIVIIADIMIFNRGRSAIHHMHKFWPYIKILTRSVTAVKC